MPHPTEGRQVEEDQQVSIRRRPVDASQCVAKRHVEIGEGNMREALRYDNVGCLEYGCVADKPACFDLFAGQCFTIVRKKKQIDAWVRARMNRELRVSLSSWRRWDRFFRMAGTPRR